MAIMAMAVHTAAGAAHTKLWCYIKTQEVILAAAAAKAALQPTAMYSTATATIIKTQGIITITTRAIIITTQPVIILTTTTIVITATTTATSLQGRSAIVRQAAAQAATAVVIAAAAAVHRPAGLPGINSLLFIA